MSDMLMLVLASFGGVPSALPALHPAVADTENLRINRGSRQPTAGEARRSPFGGGAQRCGLRANLGICPAGEIFANRLG